MKRVCFDAIRLMFNQFLIYVFVVYFLLTISKVNVSVLFVCHLVNAEYNCLGLL